MPLPRVVNWQVPCQCQSVDSDMLFVGDAYDSHWLCEGNNSKELH